MQGKAAALVAAVGFLYGVGASAMDVKPVVEVGVAMVKVTDDYETLGVDESRTGIRGGAGVEIGLSREFAVRTGIFYYQKGAEGTVDGGILDVAYTGVPLTTEAEYDYVEIPIMARYYMADGAAYAEAGLGIGINTKAEVTFSAMGVTQTMDQEDETAGIDIVLGIGAGGSFRAGQGVLSAGVRYDLGLTDIVDDPDASSPVKTAKSRAILINVGYSF